ncbi:MAG: T9SS type A sorting domain-containing protein [Candidatus Kapabacteria bacterium]|nr:T9SS type A sorting domain-containing protein [Candidatus Kapabacteria bacterium]
MDKLIKQIICIGLILTYQSYSKLDTLSNFNDDKGITYYRGSSNIALCSRFDLSKPCKLISIAITLTGDVDYDGIKIRIFGKEGGISAPLIERDLIEPLIIFKKKKGIETIQTEISGNLILDGSQFFVSIEELNRKVYLLSDIVAKKASCIDKHNEKYFVQLIKSPGQNGESVWTYGNFGFAISCVVEYIQQDANWFELIEYHNLILDSTKTKYNASFIDYDEDNYIDVLINGKLFLNQGNFKFIEYKDFLGYKTSANINLITDINNDGLIDMLFLGSDSTEKFSENGNLLFKKQVNGKYHIEKIENFDTKYINSFTMLDYNLDGITDIIFTQGTIQADTICKEFLLKSVQDESFDILSSVFSHDNHKNSLMTKVLIYDYNSDGQNDIIINNFNDYPSFYKNNLGSYDIDKRYLIENGIKEGLYSFNLEEMDVNHDGFPDLIPALEYQRSLLKNFLYDIKPGYDIDDQNNIINSYNFKMRYEDSFQGLITGDIDNDTYMDLITLPNNLCHQPTVYLNKTGNFESQSNSGFRGDNLGNDGILIDINNDGYPDVFIIDSSGIKIYKNKGNSHTNFIKFKTNPSNFNQFINSSVDIYIKGTKTTHKLSSTSGFMIQKPMEFIAGTGENYLIDSVIVSTQYKNIFKRIVLHDININIQKEIVLDYTKFVETDFIVGNLKVYPNPFLNNIIFEVISDKSCKYSLKIFDILGNIVFEKNDYAVQGNQIKLLWESGHSESVNNSSAYFYVFNICDKQFTGKLIKVN